LTRRCSWRAARLAGSLAVAIICTRGLGVGRADIGKKSPVKFEAGQLWRYQTRAKEPKSRILIQRVEHNEKLGEIVHVRVTNLKFKGPYGNVVVLPHLPYSGTALRMSLTELESSGNSVPSDYLEGYTVWREAFDAGKGGVFTLDVASVLDGMEKGVSK
jgi:hypothetical protein